MHRDDEGLSLVLAPRVAVLGSMPFVWSSADACSVVCLVCYKITWTAALCVIQVHPNAINILPDGDRMFICVAASHCLPIISLLSHIPYRSPQLVCLHSPLPLVFASLILSLLPSYPSCVGAKFLDVYFFFLLQTISSSPLHTVYKCIIEQ